MKQLYLMATELIQLNNDFFTIEINDNYTWNGAIIKDALTHYLNYYMIRPLSNNWTTFKGLFLDNYKEMFNAQFAKYDPTKNYDYNEQKIHTRSDGDETETRTPDETQNYTETTNTFNNEKKTSTGTGANQPKTDTYNVTYDTDPKHTGYTTQSGEITETYKTNGNGDKVKTVDNMKYTKTKERDEITKTIGNETYTADLIENDIISKSGNLGANIGENIKQKMENYSVFLLNQFIEHFINKYTFYVGGEY